MQRKEKKHGQRPKPIMKNKKWRRLTTLGEKNIPVHCKQRNAQQSNTSPLDEHFLNYNSQGC